MPTKEEKAEGQVMDLRTCTSLRTGQKKKLPEGVEEVGKVRTGKKKRILEKGASLFLLSGERDQR